MSELFFWLYLLGYALGAAFAGTLVGVTLTGRCAKRGHFTMRWFDEEHAVKPGENWGSPCVHDYLIVISYLIWPVALIVRYVLVPVARLAMRAASGRVVTEKLSNELSDVAARRKLAQEYIALHEEEAKAAELNDGVWPPAPKHE